MVQPPKATLDHGELDSRSFSPLRTSTGGGTGTQRYLDNTEGTDISVLTSRQQHSATDYYHCLLEVLLQQEASTPRDGEASPISRPLLDLVLAHFCPSYHAYLRSYLELAHAMTALGSVRLGAETEVFLKALLALQQLLSRPAETTRVSPSNKVANSGISPATLQGWVQTCRPSHAFAFGFDASQQGLLGGLDLLQQMIIQNLVFAVLGWTRSGGQLSIELGYLQQPSTGCAYLSLAVISPDDLMPRLIGSTLRGPRHAPGKQLQLEGTGLGYHLASSLMAQVQGELVVEVIPTGGTRFELQFPLATRTERYVDPMLILGREPVWMDPGTGFTVVYVEDVRSHALLVKQIVDRMNDVKLLLADTGKHGLELIALERPDLVLLDMELPDMSGLEVFQALQRDPATAGIPVVALSASAMSHQVGEALDLGMRHYLSKPFNHRELLAILHEEQLVKAS
ncbi:MAG TPA: hybrid sensor histidine kinase/response regulator, partial [Hyphomicrobiales bacterium]|nr:hybrid sensor histidine kinase/response regulator [Hyphomicrobiales bacterium]